MIGHAAHAFLARVILYIALHGGGEGREGTSQGPPPPPHHASAVVIVVVGGIYVCAPPTPVDRAWFV